jgi:5-methylthioadenosine/S-adenosylhomocysteine deaminase
VTDEMPATEKPAAVATDDFVLRDAIVITMDAQRNAYERGYVWVRGERIHQTGPVSELSELPPGTRVESARGRIILPGLVNGHGHLSNGILRGIYDEMPLSVWFAKGMWPVLEAMDPQIGAAGANLALLELMSTGVTTSVSAEFGTPRPDLPDGVLEAVRGSGVRAVVSRMTVDTPDESDPSQAVPVRFRETVARAIEETERLQRQYGSARITVGPEALGVLRCTPDMVSGLHDLAVRTNAPFLMHIASSKEEHASSHRRFGHGSVTELARRGALSARTLLAHAIWLDDAEIAAVADAQAGVSHNPISNAFYASGVARLSDLLQAGVRLGLGVDGASTNNGQNLWETMKMALLFQKERTGDASFGSAELALELATLGGARALHMEDRVGSLEPGKQADLISLDVSRINLAPRQTLVSNLVYSNDPQAVRDVYVAGQPVVVDGVHQLLDREAVIAAAEEALERVLERTGLRSYLETRSAWRWHRGAKIAA